MEEVDLEQECFQPPQMGTLVKENLFSSPQIMLCLYTAARGQTPGCTITKVLQKTCYECVRINIELSKVGNVYLHCFKIALLFLLID